MINDFKEVTAVVQIRKHIDPSNNKWIIITDAWQVGGESKGYQTSNDSIGIFVNYEMVFETKVKEEANRFIVRLLNKVPDELRKEFEQFKHYLLDAIEDKDGRDKQPNG